MKTEKVLGIVRALEFAAWAHSSQRRKGGAQEPYINHLTEVARLVAEATGGKDDTLIVAALLHDVLEDQSMRVSYEMLVEKFGKRVARIVREVSDDTTLPRAERKRMQIVHAPGLSRRAKILKIADKAANLDSILHSPPLDWTARRKREYFAWAAAVVAGCRGVNPWLEALFDERLERGKF